MWYYYRISQTNLIKQHLGRHIWERVCDILLSRPSYEIKSWFKFQIEGKYIMLTDHNPHDYWNTMQKLRIQSRLKEIAEEFANLGRSKDQHLIDDKDEYQEQLELGWYKDELYEEQEALKERLQSLA